jgi:hypothetical protein
MSPASSLCSVPVRAVGGLRGVAALAALGLFVSPSLAQFHVSGGIGQLYDQTTTVDEGNYDRTAATLEGEGVTFDQNTDEVNQIPGQHSQANSLGDVFGLHAHAFAQVIKPFQTNVDTDPFPRRFGITSTANVFGDYSVTVSNPNEPAGASVSTFFTMHLHGETIQGAGNTPDTINMARADAGGQVTIRGIVGGVFETPAGGSFTRQIDNGTPSNYDTGALMDFVNDRDVVTGAFTVKNGEPFTVEAQLQAYATAIGDFRESFTAEANSDLGNTLTFVTDRPVFDLPAGYTANSTDGGIIDNAFVAPEPGCIALIAAALLMFPRRSRAR